MKSVLALVFVLAFATSAVTAQSYSCDLCEVVAMFAEEYSNVYQLNETAIQDSLLSVCAYVPEDLSFECKAFIDTTAPAIIKKIVNGSDPASVCAELDLCTAVIAFQQSNNTCTYCEYVVEVAELAVKFGEFNESQFLDTLEGVCSLLGPLQSECDQFVSQYAGQILNEIEQGANPETVCAQLDICDATFQLKLKQENGTCTYCEYTVEVVELAAEFGALGNVSALISSLNSFCNSLGPFSSECLDFVDEYAEKIIEEIQNGTPAEEVCQNLGLCSSATLIRTPTVSIIGQENNTCVFCEYAVEGIEFAVQFENLNESAILALLNGVCAVFGPLQSECESFVDQYAEQLIEELEKGTPAEQVCAQLGLCSSSVVVVSPLGSNNTCTYCEWVVEVVEVAIKVGNLNETAIIAHLEEVCSLLGTYSTECNLFVEMYGANIITELENGAEPGTVCEQLSLCTSFAMTAVYQDDNTTCSVCIYIAQAAEFVTSEGNFTAAEIEAALSSFCGLLGDYESECNLIMDIYGDQIVSQIVAGKDAETICASIELCTSSSIITLPTQDSTCTLCEYTVQLYELAEEAGFVNNTLILSQLDSLCSILPAGEIQQECDDFLNNYAEQILQQLQDNAAPETVCAELALCSQAVVVNVQQDNNGTCDMCEQLVPFLEYALQLENVTQDEILELLDLVCTMIPDNATQALCEQLIQSYAAEIIKELESGTPAEQICSQIGLCSSAMATKLPVIVAPQQDVYCSLCEYTVQLVELAMEAGFVNTTTIVAAIDSVCDVIPDFETECDDYVNNYVEEIIAELQQGANPDTVCQSFALCSQVPIKILINIA